VTDTDKPLDEFKAHGGKLLSWVGASDQGIFPRGAIHYYRQMAADIAVRASPTSTSWRTSIVCLWPPALITPVLMLQGQCLSIRLERWSIGSNTELRRTRFSRPEALRPPQLVAHARCVLTRNERFTAVPAAPMKPRIFIVGAILKRDPSFATMCS